MLINEIDRRQFLKSVAGAAAGAAVSSTAQAAAGGFHLPYQVDREIDVQEEWKKLSPQQQKIWTKRAEVLQATAIKIFQKLSNFVGENEKKYLKGVVIKVPVIFAVYDWARVHLGDKLIEIDVGTFWDLGDDTLAYTLGHEIAHIVYTHSGQHPMDTTRVTPAQKWANVQKELQCDTYGATLAYKAGYDPRRAWDKMDQEAKSWKYNPKDNNNNYYPDYSMRVRNLNQTIQKVRQELEAAKLASDRAAAEKAQQDLENLVQQLHNQKPPEQLQPNEDQLSMVSREMFKHIMRGISNLS
jgi:hypothetical protein